MGATGGLNQIIDRFESDWNPEIDWTNYVPAESHAEYEAVIIELIRVDMEFRWLQQKAGRELISYLNQTHFIPNDEQLSELCFEEYRLRAQTISPVPTEYFAKNYGVDVSTWRESTLDPPHADHIRFPEIGDEFHGFELCAVLGKGAFGCVYLAQQKNLANRFVALKVTNENDAEPQALARLQHTNIVPIHSLHRDGSLQSLCMPFLGCVTLLDLVKGLGWRDRDSDGAALLSTVVNRRAETVLSNTNESNRPTIEKDLLSVDASLDSSRFCGMGYQEMILWMGSQLADGIAFSHSRGVLHGDIKPANILVTDEGQPLLLDFHLASGSIVTKSSQVAGGTLPYMSGRQLKSFYNDQGIDEESDLFGLGVVLYEALTGGHPYPDRGTDDHAIQKMIEDRKQPPRPMRVANRMISVDAATIVEKCLGVHGGYHNAVQLREDLQLHLANRPLRFAKNRSVYERCKKWMLRHPKLASATTFAICSFVFLGLATALVYSKLLAASKTNAKSQSEELIETVDQNTIPLIGDKLQPSLLDDRSQALAQAIKSMTDEPAFSQRRELLNSGAIAREDEAIQRAIYWQSRSQFIVGLNQTGQKYDRHAEAVQWLELASSKTGKSHHSLLKLQRDILREMGDRNQADRLQSRLDSLTESQTKTDSALDSFYTADELHRLGSFVEAEAILSELADNLRLFREFWMLRAYNFRKLNRPKDAIACYTLSLGLSDDDVWPYFFRGAAYLETRNYEQAKADFDRVIESSEFEAAYLNRALAWYGLKQFQPALQDIQQAIDLGGEETRAHYLRFKIFRQLGDSEQAKQALNTFLELEPKDELSWLSRGIAQMSVNQPEKALADFRAALDVNPNSRQAYQNIATVQAQHLNHTNEAIEAMSEIVKNYPRDAVAVVTRGVLLARSGDRERAHQDAIVALSINRSADTLFRAAGVYALTGVVNEDDKSKAVLLLTEAAFKDGRLVNSRIHSDHDLDSIRDDSSFISLIEQLKNLSNYTFDKK